MSDGEICFWKTRKTLLILHLQKNTSVPGSESAITKYLLKVLTLGPTTPLTPFSPLGPSSPSSPLSPFIPWNPGGPLLPLSPCQQHKQRDKSLQGHWSCSAARFIFLFIIDISDDYYFLLHKNVLVIIWNFRLFWFPTYMYIQLNSDWVFITQAKSIL